MRVRRDADEQLVLAHVVDRLSNLVSVLTVQVFKDEWAMRKGGIIPTPSAPLLPILNTSAALALPYNNSVSSNQNGIAFPYHSMGPFLHAQSSTLPVSHPLTSSTQVNDPQMREPSQCKYPVREAWDVSPQHKNPIPSDCSVSSLQQKAYVNNILISGTRTLVANRSAYHPR